MKIYIGLLFFTYGDVRYGESVTDAYGSSHGKNTCANSDLLELT